MKKSPSLTQTRINLMVCLALSRAPSRALTAREVAGIAGRAGWLTHAEKLSVRSRVDSRAENMFHRVVYHRDSRMNPIRRGYINWDESKGNLSLLDMGCQLLIKIECGLGGTESGEFTAIKSWLLAWANKKGSHF